jgi:hypothetical protein
MAIKANRVARMKRSSILTMCVALTLPGCGGGNKAQVGPPPLVGIYTSAADCAENKKLEVAECNQLIYSAIENHQQTTKPYISMRLCEVVEGVDRCERTGENAFRVKLQAFLITFSTPPQVETLYAVTEKGVIGFTNKTKSKTVLTIDETLTFSEHAKVVAEGYAY